MTMRTLDRTMLVAPQIGPDDVSMAAAAGVRLIVNNRPDGEEPGQPDGATIAAAAEAAGIGYRAIPVDHGGISPAQIAQMADAVAGADGPVLAYCRSGTRSTFLWAMARASGGDPPPRLIEQAAAAGYDLAPIRPLLDRLAEAGRRDDHYSSTSASSSYGSRSPAPSSR